MRTKTSVTLLIILSLVTLGNVPADASELTLNDCIELSLQNRTSIIAVRGRESVAKAIQRSSLGAFLPSLNASYNQYKSKRTDGKFSLNGGEEYTTPDQDVTGKSLQLSADIWAINIPVWFNYFGSRADRARAHLDVINSEQDLIYSVKTAYYAYLAAAENVSVQEEAVLRSEEQLKLIETKYELGSAALSDVLKQKVQFGNDRLGLLSAQNNVADSKANLAYTIGMDPNNDIEFSTGYISREYEGTLNDAIQFGLTYEPGLLAAQKNLDARNIKVRSEKAQYLPKMRGYGYYSWSDGTQGDTTTYNSSSKSKTLGFTISWNIFDGFSRERGLTSAKTDLNDARANLAETRNLVSKEIRTAYLEIEKLKEQKNVSQENLDASQEDLRITQEKYNLGAATILDLLNAQVNVKSAQVSLIRADFDLNLAVARLENAMGKM